MHKKILKEKEIENSMVDALNNGEFIVYFQPKYSLSDYQIIVFLAVLALSIIVFMSLSLLLILYIPQSKINL